MPGMFLTQSPIYQRTTNMPKACALAIGDHTRLPSDFH